MEKVTLIALDIGGTLLSYNNTICEQNLRAIEYARSKGIKIALATAREYSSTKYISHQIGCDYGVFSNGSHLLDVKHLKTLKTSLLQCQAVLEINRYCKKNGLYIHLNQEFSEVSDQMKYFNLKHNLLNTNYPDSLKSNCFLVDNLENYIKNQSITKIVIVSDDHLEKHIKGLSSILTRYGLFITEYNKDLYEDILGKIINYIEIGSVQDTKANGLIELANVLSVPKSEIAVFGDGENDLEMFTEFECSFCMSNGSEKVKKLARHVTQKDNNHGGVAEGIYSLIGGK